MTNGLALARTDMPLLTIQELRTAEAPRTYRPHTTTKRPAFDWAAHTPACKTCGTKTGSVNTHTGQCRTCDPPEPVAPVRPKPPKTPRAPRAPRSTPTGRRPGRPRLALDVDAVIEAYTGGQTIPDIATALRADRSRVKAAILEAGIPLRDDRQRVTGAAVFNNRNSVDEGAVVRMYLEGTTAPHVAEAFGVLPKRVRDIVLRHGHELRDDRKAHSGSHLKDYDPDLVAQVRSLYLDQQLSQERTAFKLGIGIKVVQRIMERHDIPARQHQTGRQDGAVGLRVRMTELGVTSRQIKDWALSVGLVDKISVGLPSERLVTAYAAAHTPAGAA